MIELSNVNKIFGRRPAVVDLSLKIPRGDIFGLLGHNGAGKSTAIGMMLGQVWPSAGTVRVGGFEVATQRSRALEKVGAIFETPVFYDYLSGWRNLEILSHYTAPTPAKRIREIVELVGLTGREGSRVKTYSHGMRARLALAQALLPNPELLILDEPSDGLDPEGIHEMRETIRRLHRELNLTILLSSHLLNEVEQVCNRICVLHQGCKVFEGSLAEATQTRNWVRLVTSDFGAAVSRLQQSRLVTSSSEGKYVTMADGVGTDQVVRVLVEAGMPVFEIAREERTLESFYLNLMQENTAAKKAKSSALPPPLPVN